MASGHAAPRVAAPGPLRLLVVDDSIVARTVIAGMLDARPEFGISAVARSADEALAILDRTAVDIILLDVEMPGTDGLTALPAIVARGRGARVMVVSSAAADGSDVAVRALALGAVDTLLKPEAAAMSGRFADTLVERLIRIGAGGPRSTPSSRDAAAELPTISDVPVECLAIGASTGGLPALSAFFRGLPEKFAAPILITQHLPPAFIPFFATQIADLTHRVVEVAAEGMPIERARVLIAPGDGHLALRRGRRGPRVVIDRAPAASGCMPSVDPMFLGLAAVFGAAGLGVVLSGMGRDGAIGAAEIRRAGGEVYVQDAGSSVVWGMPGAVANAGLANAVLPPALLGARAGARERKHAWK